MDFTGVIMEYILFPFAVVLGILWLIFPWFVYRRLTDLVEVERGVEKSLQQILHTLYKNQEYVKIKKLRTRRVTRGLSVLIGAGAKGQTDKQRKATCLGRLFVCSRQITCPAVI